MTLKLITHLIKPTEGSLNAKGTISYAPDHFPSDLNLTIEEYLNSIIKLGKCNVDNNRLSSIIRKLQLKPYFSSKIKSCSKGTRQKINIIQCLIQSADIYVLDEPFSGLDQPAINYLINCLQELKSFSTIVLTSHDSVINKNLITHTFDLETKHLKVNQSNPIPLKEIIVSNCTTSILSNILNSLKYKPKINKIENTSRNNITVPEKYSNQILYKLLQHNINIVQVNQREGVL